ncbi:alpha/beta hydrolase [Marinobacter salinisoli]|uniref:Alpha/beta hydrolase n=1 Tax=Marinobacter salinisoli TaxID=2769486 RepID=A0ABX7MV39_9GAMM|nr:alpha/beta hydrolase [Marinobacter salinisoli]QSP96240.1 alpha/beta hydrolase [Marinobacter salinisoli]
MPQTISGPRVIELPGYTCLAFNEDSKGEPVVLIHGLISSVYFWHPPHLSVFGDRPVYAIALPGHYPSASLSGSERIDAERLTDALFEQIHALIGNRRCVLVGHSTGGQAALFAATRRPGQILGVVAMGSALTGQEDNGVYAAFQWLATRMGRTGRSLVATVLKLNALAEPIHRLFMRDVVASPRIFFAHADFPAYLQAYFPAMQRICRRSMGIYFRDLVALDLTPHLASLRCPTLVLCGNQDPYVSIQRTHQLADAIPGSEKVFIDGSGHMPMFENWPEYSKAMASFMQRIEDACQTKPQDLADRGYPPISAALSS